MDKTMYTILAVDPGNEKTGMAVLHINGELIERRIVETASFNDSVEQVLTAYRDIRHIVCGNGTNHKYLYPALQQIGRNHKITTSLIDEAHSTEEARKLYWEYNPPTGWRKLIPRGMRFPSEPVDDLTAYVIGIRYTDQVTRSLSQETEVSADSGEDAEQRRLEAMKKLYGNEDVHE